MFTGSFRQGETISDDMSDNIQSLALMAWDEEMSQFIKEIKETNRGGKYGKTGDKG